MVYSRSSYSSLPSEAGVYVYLDKNGTVLYVGKAKDLKSRVSSYFAKSAQLGEKTKVLVSQIHKINITIVESEIEALLLEAFYIKKYSPKYNIRLTDNKSYIRIRITNIKENKNTVILDSDRGSMDSRLRGNDEKRSINDKYPRVLLARSEEDKDSVYYGPFPSSTAVKLVLKTIRRVFPFVSVRSHPKRICLYNHLGLCPCPPIFASEALQKSYRKNINGLIRVFEGQSKKIMKEWEKERDKFSNDEEYEKAMAVQKKINALSLITTPYHKPFEYDVNPNLRVDIRQNEMNGLIEVLNENGFELKSLERIECYDISNIQGTNATASMVVFTNGEKDSSQYRKFKIKREWDKRSTKELPNDFAMMQEVLLRRLRHEDWHYPNLIIVDGGKGQVSSAMKVLTESGMDIPLIGLAKREETIVVPNVIPDLIRNPERIDSRLRGNDKSSEDNFTEVSLPKNSPSLHLLQRIRDEAHRFAITYHRKLRSKSVLA